ncbi:XrtA/PEP-CTERM system histidine kinase PrsK [Noviherbaspirillum suwonense]|uniref:histidine kinase n=1 Tax=Noviherbaspirillum suwonense TaxID=1224511 RepID=A0ABY1QGW7_9BURK|nr:XrtA/PEP-CTERM system histidine kinase PrsK [Noviherbaspirillum suwonense]SMP69385.1 putative PEP-CTERM system histidine kinase [Noviherbaspirillum suwonense]
MVVNVIAVSYGIAAAAFLLLTLLLLTSWRGRLHGMALTAASGITALWAGVVAQQASAGIQLSLASDMLELARNAAWTIFLVAVLSPYRKDSGAPVVQSRLLAPGLAMLYILCAAGTVYSRWILRDVDTQIYFMANFVGRVAMAVIGMLLVEQLYRSTPPQERWAIKFACLGVGGLYVYDFYLYSDAMLFRALNVDIWAARGMVNALAVPLIAVSAARNPKWSLDIAVSRRVIFHSAAVVGSALYLLMMALAGYWLRFFGGSWGSVMQVTFFAAALALLAGIVFSGTVRSRLKVFISKNFYNYNYDYREEWLRFTRTLSTKGPDLGERAVQAIADLVESPTGALWLSNGAHHALLAHWHMPDAAGSEPADSAFCSFLQGRQWVVDLDELEADPEKYEGLVAPEWLRKLPRAWLVVPLIMHEELLGFVVLSQPRSRIRLNWEVTDLLKIAGNQAASYLAQQQSANALMVARQFESFNRMSTFIVHDLKNLIFQLSLLVANAEKHRDNPEFQKDMMDTLDNSVKKMKLLLHKLNSGDSIEGPAPLSLDKLLAQAVQLKSQFEPRPTLELHDKGLTLLANWGRMERVVGHLIQNAIEASPRDGRVLVALRRQDENAVIEISDNGAGMTEEFMRSRLFKPFETTKSAGMGVGVFESREYIQELGGRLDVASRAGEGTTFTMTLPLNGARAGQRIDEQQEESA